MSDQGIERLQASNERLTLALEGWGLGIFDIDETSGQIIGDPTIERIFRVDSGAMNSSVAELRVRTSSKAFTYGRSACTAT